MTLDRSLKNRGGMSGRRSVLTRTERIQKMMEEGNFDPETDKPTGLPKYRTVLVKTGKKKK